MADWLWYGIFGFNLGSMAACWYTIAWYWRRQGRRWDQWRAEEQAQQARWQAAWRPLAASAGATGHEAPLRTGCEEEPHG